MYIFVLLAVAGRETPKVNGNDIASLMNEQSQNEPLRPIITTIPYQQRITFPRALVNGLSLSFFDLVFGF